MTMEHKSKRDIRREQMAKKAKRSQLSVALVITAIAAFFLFAILWPQFRPLAEIVPVEDVRERYMADGASMGDPNAPIKMVEYSDFQCPFCDRHYTETEPVLEQYYIDTGLVHFTYKSAGNFVSRNSPNTESQDAAAAAYCAADQGKFWEMHDALFINNRDVENDASFAPRRLTDIAEVVGLNMDEYQECFDSGKYEERVSNDLVEGTELGLEGTPYFIITYTVDGVEKTDFINGAVAFNEFQVKLEAILFELGLK